MSIRSASVLGRTDAQNAVRLAIRAPSIHNTQPWIWRANPSRIDLFADRSRQLEFVDPGGRALRVSCGAALFLLRAALLTAGWAESTTRTPNPYDADHLATVMITGHRPVEPEWVDIVAAARRRRTDRRPFLDEPIGADIIADLCAQAVLEGASLRGITRPEDRLVVAVAVGRADDYEAADPRYRAEMSRWTAGSGRDGVPASAVPRGSDRRTDVPLRDFEVGQVGTLPIPRPRPVEHDALFVLATGRDGAVDQIRAGEALCRVLLAVTRHGLAASPYTQPIEIPAPRLLLSRVLGGYGEPQIVLRVGRPGPGVEPPLTPRRPTAEVFGWSAKPEK